MTPREQAIWDAAYAAAYFGGVRYLLDQEVPSGDDPSVQAGFEEKLDLARLNVGASVRIANEAVDALRCHRIDKPDAGEYVK